MAVGGAPELIVADVIELMAAMAQHRIASLEYGGAKLILAPAERQVGSAVSSYGPPSQVAPTAPMSSQSAAQHVALAQVAAKEAQEKRLAAAQARTAAARAKVVSHVGAVPPAAAVAAIYEASKVSGR